MEGILEYASTNRLPGRPGLLNRIRIFVSAYKINSGNVSKLGLKDII